MQRNNVTYFGLPNNVWVPDVRLLPIYAYMCDNVTKKIEEKQFN